MLAFSWEAICIYVPNKSEFLCFSKWRFQMCTGFSYINQFLWWIFQCFKINVKKLIQFMFFLRFLLKNLLDFISLLEIKLFLAVPKNTFATPFPVNISNISSVALKRWGCKKCGLLAECNLHIHFIVHTALASDCVTHDLQNLDYASVSEQQWFSAIQSFCCKMFPALFWCADGECEHGNHCKRWFCFKAFMKCLHYSSVFAWF